MILFLGLSRERPILLLPVSSWRGPRSRCSVGKQGKNRSRNMIGHCGSRREPRGGPARQERWLSFSAQYTAQRHGAGGQFQRAERRAKRQAAGGDCKLQIENLKLKIFILQFAIFFGGRTLCPPSPIVTIECKLAFFTLDDKVESAYRIRLCSRPLLGHNVQTFRRCHSPPVSF